MATTGFGVKKYTSYEDDVTIPLVERSAFNFILIRYAEVLLTYAEAQNEASGPDQSVYDAINQLRRRPDINMPEVPKGLTKDQMREVIRRERRMELVYEHCRLHDIKRWKKLEYMNNSKYPDTMTGPWVDMPKEVPTYLDDQYIGKRQVKKEDGSIITFDGTNAADMVGYYLPTNALPRNTFSDRSYCSPVGEQEINTYAEKGFKLTQTKGW